jgi:sterol desaturase/sphingolipid hydroxylase (fatty acid hydroxylase superfamily)
MEAAIRLGVFAAVFVAVAAVELRRPKRPLAESRWRRWRVNLSIFVIDVLLLRVTLGAAAYATALYAEARGWGLFGTLGWPLWFEALLAIIALDLAIYLQHVLSHALPAFWRLHKVHHLDLDFDLTTGLRFHPGEILISMVYKMGLVAALGASPWAVLIYEAILNGFSLWTHGNMRLPAGPERLARLVFCTSDMHRVHHSTIPLETNSNYGNFLSIWDRLCGTMAGHEGMELGLREEREQARIGFIRLLVLPFMERP